MKTTKFKIETRKGLGNWLPVTFVTFDDEKEALRMAKPKHSERPEQAYRLVREVTTLEMIWEIQSNSD